ncbi:hypothetical protein [Nitratidesulfovibrio liaohensis]|uniref:Uncharacterized protein n=1 Tax=Nitratidesulfovibrio liaohensis TaxID=2604158 RepID=A0ABY9R0W1_9BACT|nr:hypothetical protein [Nitratidesulfovibrio liaohensis]WMW65396.1 hypothetical protein KPS_003522 [Nitratidesulfovibrio liaohensis]
MSTDFAMQFPGLRRMSPGLLRAMSAPLDPWRDPPYLTPPSPTLLDKTQIVVDDMEADAAAERQRLQRAGYSPPEGDTRHQSPLVAPERITGTLVSLIG